MAGRDDKRSVFCDQRGQATVEYALLLAAIVLPLGYVFLALLQMLGIMFQMTTFIHSLPFP